MSPGGNGGFGGVRMRREEYDGEADVWRMKGVLMATSKVVSCQALTKTDYVR